MANKYSRDWQAHDDRLAKAMKSENDRTKQMQDLLRSMMLPLGMGMAGAGAKPEPPKSKEGKR